jgi:tetratricopeptide (TPR) repeat protein
MRTPRLILIGCLLCVAAASFAVPKVLIVQVSSGTKSDTSPILLSDALAQALEEEGKCDPIVWSQTDPVFRGAMLDGRVPTTEKPTPEDVATGQKALACDYVILTQVQIQGTALVGRIDMYKGAKPFWNDSTTMDPGRSSSNDLENAVLSIARTWALHISAGPLKAITAEPKAPPAAGPSQGQIPKSTVTDPVPIVTDSVKAIAEYEKLMAANQVSEATNLLRQAVDSSPLDVSLRVKLIQHLTKIGRGNDAAEEARRASKLLPDSAELRALAAHAYIDSGQSDQAESQLNEALARNPEDPVTRAMLADIALNSQKTQAALEHIDVAMKKAPSKDLAYRRALCDAMIGDQTATQNDFALAAQLPNWTGSEDDSYKFCRKVFDAGMDQTIGDLRSLYQRAAVRRDDPEVAKAIEDQLAILQARQMFIDTWTPPSSHKKSQGICSLALKLLSQSLSELKAYLSDGSQDTLTDAGIDLGESIKQLSSARGALATEGTVARDGSTTVYSNN